MENTVKNCFDFRLIVKSIYYYKDCKIQRGNTMKIIDKTTIKFIFVGIINTVVGTAVMLVLYNLFNANYWFASTMNYLIGSIVSYFLNKYFTFQNNEKSIKQIVQFVINITICYLLAYGIAKPLVGIVLSGCSLKIQENIAMLVGMCFFVGLNYIGQKFIVFKSENKISDGEKDEN